MLTSKDIVDQIIHGDCLERLKELPDNSVDLVCTDPPYGMEYQSSWRTDKFDKIYDDDNIDWLPAFANEVYRVLKQDTHIYCFCNDYAISDFRRALESAGFTPKRTLVWVKNNHTSGDLEGDYGNKTEFIVFAHKSRRELNGKRDTNVLNCARVSEMVHPTQKPVELLSYLIKKSSNPGDIVLDPFVGSGTTCVAARQNGRHYLGIEKDLRYAQIAVSRLAAIQQTLAV